MKRKEKVKFDLNETIRRLNAISQGFQASADRLEKIVVNTQAKKDAIHQRYQNALDSIHKGIQTGEVKIVNI